MDDSIQAFVDQLRSLLQAPDPAQTAELVVALATFGGYCEETNRRLRECLALISKGQYANAVELAEREPNLIDRCSLLDIPERDMLPTVARSVSAPTPAVIGRELVEALQEAYQKGSTAAGNRRLLHKLALGRAPLPARLAVMRRLAIQDPNHPFLDSDIRNFERAWFKQALAVAQRAAGQGDAALVEELVDDLQNGGYLETPPAALMTSLQKALWKARTAMLPALAESIHSAFRDNAFAKLKELAAQWNIFAEGIPDAATRFQVADALEWFWQETDRQKHAAERDVARTRLSGLMESPDVTQPALESAYQAAVVLGALDAGLETAFRSRVRQIERRRLAILAGKAALVLVLVSLPVIVLIVWAMNSAAHKRDVAALTTELRQVIQPDQPMNIWNVKAQDLQQALKTVTNSRPAVANDEQVLTLRKIAEAEIDRREQLDRALAAIHDCPLGKDVGPLVAAARQHQKTEDDESRIVNAETEWKERSAQQIAAFNKRAGDLLARSNEVADSARRAQAASDDQLPALRRDLQSLQADARRMDHDDPRLQTISDNLGSMDNWKKFAVPVHDFERSMRGVKVSPEALQRIASHLTETIAKHCPNRAAQANAELAPDSVDMWNRLCDLVTTLNQKGSAAGSLDWSKLATDWKEAPFAALLDLKRQHVEMLRQRNPDSQGTSSAMLRNFVNQRGIAKVWMLQNKDATPETRYYFSSEPAVNKQSRYKTTALVALNGVTREVNLEQKKYKKPVLSPQSVIAKAALDIWKPGNQASWNRSLAEVFETLCRSTTSEAMDPLIKLRLVHDFLLLASESSLGFRRKLEGLPACKKLTANEVLTLTAGNWLDPREDDRLKSQRASAAELATEAPDLLALLADADEFDRQQAELVRKDNLTWIGWLAPGEQRPVAVVPFADRGPLRPGKIYVVVNAKFIAIGSVVGDKEVLDSVAVEYLGYPALTVIDVLVK
jgi:hypothetical protein